MTTVLENLLLAPDLCKPLELLLHIRLAIKIKIFYTTLIELFYCRLFLKFKKFKAQTATFIN